MVGLDLQGLFQPKLPCDCLPSPSLGRQMPSAGHPSGRTPSGEENNPASWARTHLLVTARRGHRRTQRGARPTAHTHSHIPTLTPRPRPRWDPQRDRCGGPAPPGAARPSRGGPGPGGGEAAGRGGRGARAHFSGGSGRRRERRPWLGGRCGPRGWCCWRCCPRRCGPTHRPTAPSPTCWAPGSSAFGERAAAATATAPRRVRPRRPCPVPLPRGRPGLAGVVPVREECGGGRDCSML